MTNDPQDDFAAIAKPLPTGKGAKTPAESDDFSAIAHPVEFTDNSNGEGTYEMAAPHGGKIKIPYSKIGDASKAGYKMSDADRVRYVSDAAVDPNLKHEPAPEGVTVTGRNSAGQPIYAPKGQEGSALSRFSSAEYGAIGGAAKGLVKFLDPRPSEEEKKRGQTTTLDILMRYPERIIQPNVDALLQGSDEAKAGNYSAAAEHRLAGAIPLVGPFASSVIDQTGEQVAKGNYAGAAGNVVGNAMVAEAPKVGGAVAKGALGLVPKAADSFVRAVTKTGPREVKALAKHTEAENAESATRAEEVNAKNAEKHLVDTLDAVQESNKHANKEGFRSDELERQNELKRQEFNKKELERVKAEGDKRLEALKANKDKITDYEERREAIKKQNEANYRREVRQQNLQTKLKAATTKIDDLYKKTFKDATTKYNATWNKWRDQVKDAKADMAPTVDVIKAQENSMNPQQVAIFKDIMRETTPGEEDLSESEQARKAAIKDLGWKDAKYEKLDAKQKSVVDDVTGLTNLDDIQTRGLKNVPASRLHGWKSQLERAVRTTQDGTVRYAIGKVLQQLRQTEQDVSATVGPDAVKQLAKARSITGPYFEAFFKSPDELPRAAGQSLRELNSEYVKEKGAQQRLDRIAKYNPEFGPAAKLVANLQQGLEGIAKEKNIGKRSELPLRPDLKDVPTVTPAGEFQPKPFHATPGSAKIVTPDRPLTEEAAKKTLSTEDYKEWKAENMRRTSQHLRDLAISRAMYASMNAVPIAVASFAMGHPLAAALELSTPVGVIAYSNAVASLLEKPGVVEYLSRVSDKDVAEFEKLPPKQKALFKDDMQALTKEAKKQGVTISPAMSAFIASPTATERKKKATPQELLQQAQQNLQSGFQQSGYSR